jgi:MFS family permease
MNEKNLVLVLGLAGFVVMADSWVVSPILPAIAHSLKIGPVRAGLLITAYMLPFGRSQLLFGPLADRYGKRRVISFSTTFFAIGTGLCTYINIVEVQPGLGLGQPNFGRCFSSRTPRPSISS